MGSLTTTTHSRLTDGFMKRKPPPLADATRADATLDTNTGILTGRLVLRKAMRMCIGLNGKWERFCPTFKRKLIL